MDPKEYKAKPLKRVYIEKKGKKGKKRPLSIPTMRDRAMQALFAEALSPVAEVGGDRHSYGFRKGRSTQDAYAQILVNLSHKNSAEWVLEGDIKGCFDNIDHEWLLRNIPMDKGMLRQFLKAGYMHQGLLHDAANGTPQGGIISPILANMALDGIDGLLDRKYHTNHSGGHRVNYVRYADDFIVTARTEEMAWEIKGMLAEFMSERGLELSSEKTLVTRVDEGFDFLGWTFRKFRGKLVPMPSKASVKRFLGGVKQVVKKVGPAVTQDELIAVLNPKIRGFANYHKNACSSRTFGYIDNRIYRLLVGWAKRKHGKKNAKWRHKRYWRSRGGRNYIFGTEERTLLLMSWQHIVRRSPLACEKNPYINPEYFDKRAYEHRRKARNSFRPAAP